MATHVLGNAPGPSDVQFGVFNTDPSFLVHGATWVDRADNVSIGATSYLVAIYDLAPAALNGKLVTSVNLTLRNVQTDPERDHYIDVYSYRGPLVSDFSTTNLPNHYFTLAKAEAFVVHSVSGSFVNLFPLSLPLHTADGRANSLGASLHANWPLDGSGRRRWVVALRLNPSRHSNPQLMNFSSLLSTTLTYQDAFTGLEGPWEARGRADECPICGRKSTRDTWVRNDYFKMMACPECYDEEDRVGRHYVGLGSERPGSGEG